MFSWDPLSIWESDQLGSSQLPSGQAADATQRLLHLSPASRPTAIPFPLLLLDQNSNSCCPSCPSHLHSHPAASPSSAQWLVHPLLLGPDASLFPTCPSLSFPLDQGSINCRQLPSQKASPQRPTLSLHSQRPPLAPLISAAITLFPCHATCPTLDHYSRARVQLCWAAHCSGQLLFMCSGQLLYMRSGQLLYTRSFGRWAPPRDTQNSSLRPCFMTK